MTQPQSYSNHVRRDPVFFFIMLTLLLNVIYRVVEVFRHFSPDRLWAIVVAVALLLLGSTTRSYALRVQDRVIRFEERTRLARLASPFALARMEDLTVRQLVALRFASDAELGSLADRALKEQLTPKQIKQSIVDWKPDVRRV